MHMCEDDDNKPEVVPCVSFPDEKEVKDTWECPECRRAFDIEKLLNPKVWHSSNCLLCYCIVPHCSM